MPSDLLFPPLEDAEKTIGKSGHMHGANMVMIPAKNEKTRSVSINLPWQNPGIRSFPHRQK